MQEKQVDFECVTLAQHESVDLSFPDGKQHRVLAKRAVSLVPVSGCKNYEERGTGSVVPLGSAFVVEALDYLLEMAMPFLSRRAR